MREHQTGASLVEFALLIALLSLVCIGAMSAMASSTANSLCKTAGNVEGADGGTGEPVDYYWDEDLGECRLCEGGWGGSC